MSAYPGTTTGSISTTFRSRALPSPLAGAIRERLEQAHAAHPFSPLHPRQAVRRVADILGAFGVESVVYRGGLDLRGAEVDHVWLAAAATPEPQEHDGEGPYVLDVAFPLFDGEFVDVLRRFVAGDGAADELAAAAEGARVTDRVLGLVPPPMRYVGSPVWSSR